MLIEDIIDEYTDADNFGGKLKCEGCGQEEDFRSQNTDFYREIILPRTKCKFCKKTRYEIMDDKFLRRAI